MPMPEEPSCLAQKVTGTVEPLEQEYNNSSVLAALPNNDIESIPLPPRPPRTVTDVLTDLFLVVFSIVVAFIICSLFPQFEVLSREKILYTTLWMSAQTFWRENWLWTVNHVTEGNMFILQSVVTCGALFW